jgi:hypothetical protein
VSDRDLSHIRRYLHKKYKFVRNHVFIDDEFSKLKY